MNRRNTLGRTLLGLSLIGAAGVATALAPTTALTTAVMASQGDEDGQDILIFRSGVTTTGKIIEETATKIVFKGVISGIETTAEFDKADILKIKRGVAVAEPGLEPEREVIEARADERDPVLGDSESVYVLELTGVFGKDIAPKPIEQALKDVQRLEPDYLIVVVDNQWDAGLFGGLEEQDLGDERTNFDEFSIADRIEPLFTERMQREWDNPPEVVFWVKQAMGGAAFLPFTSPNMYFASDARLGGIGYLDRLFGSTGDEVVRQKQYSLRLGRAKGMALQAGYDPKIIEALTWAEYVLSYSLEGGKPVYHEREPEHAGEILLTDNASQQDGKEDTIEELARGEGNDCLTLKAETAQALQVSDGTADTLDDLLYLHGIKRGFRILDGRGDRIMDQWRGSVRSAERELPRLMRDFQRIEVQGQDARERNRQRGKQIKKLNDIKRLVQKFDGALVPQRYDVPGIAQLDIMISEIELQITADRD